MRHNEIINEICRICGIPERRKKGCITLNKKEALQVLTYIKIKGGVNDGKQ